MHHDIRPAVKSDRDWLWSLYCSTMREHVERAWGRDEKFQRESFDKYLPAEEFQLIYKNNVLVGAYLLEDKHDHFWLEMLLIDPDHQNQGIGSEVLKNLVSNRCTPKKPLKFSVIKSNPACSLYKKLGFNIYDEDKSFYKMTSERNQSMYPDVILLNGTCSSGKTSLAKELQELLPIQYLNFSIDSVLYALPPSDLKKMIKGKPIKREGYDYNKLTKGYHNCVKGLLESGCRIIIDNAWIKKDEIEDLNNLLDGFNVLRVKVQCRLEVCESRELARGDRAIGLAKREYPLVHQYMVYNVTVDTSDVTPLESAQEVYEWVKNNGKSPT